MKTLFSGNLGFWVETEGLVPNLGSTVSLRIEYFFKIETFLKLYNGTLDFWQIWQIFGTYGGYLANFWYLRGYLAKFLDFCIFHFRAPRGSIWQTDPWDQEL